MNHKRPGLWSCRWNHNHQHFANRTAREVHHQEYLRLLCISVTTIVRWPVLLETRLLLRISSLCLWRFPLSWGPLYLSSHHLRAGPILNHSVHRTVRGAFGVCMCLLSSPDQTHWWSRWASPSHPMEHDRDARSPSCYELSIPWPPSSFLHRRLITHLSYQLIHLSYQWRHPIGWYHQR